jgi:hypothetical protein
LCRVHARRLGAEHFGHQTCRSWSAAERYSEFFVAAPAQDEISLATRVRRTQARKSFARCGPPRRARRLQPA